MLVIKNEAQFTKKAKGQIIFSCSQGKEIDMLLQKAIETGIGQTITLTAEGRDASEGGPLPRAAAAHHRASRHHRPNRHSGGTGRGTGDSAARRSRPAIAACECGNLAA